MQGRTAHGVSLLKQGDQRGQLVVAALQPALQGCVHAVCIPLPAPGLPNAHSMCTMLLLTKHQHQTSTKHVHNAPAHQASAHADC